LFAAVAQDFQNQEEVGEEDEAEQAHPLLDPHENRQHHQVRLPYLSHINGSLCAFQAKGSAFAFRYNAKRRHWRRTKLGF